ncbi:ABC transporter ATP-binding protein [Corynebacterium pygosceleis]|uniref:ABC transporter ATP-binding protein n=1 Tax=Corynebacterium pygosceleis TaxID=2800406 RepID=UPI00396A55F5
MVTRQNPRSTPRVTLELDDVTVGYRRRRVIENFTTEPVHGGHVVGLLGPNASGKSTLIKAIAGVHRTTGGRLRATVEGRVHEGRDLRRVIGYVPQDLPDTAALTAFETVLVAARRACSVKITGTPAVELASRVMTELSIGDLARRYISELSGGQRQLTAVAQMMVSDPDVMLLDEPTSALDLHRQLFLLDVIRRRARETGAVALTAIHDINLAARFCDELLVMRGGRVIAQGAPRTVLTPGLLSEVYGVDAEILDHGGVPVVAPVAG